MLSSPIQAISQSIIQTVDVLPDVQGFPRVESTVATCEPTSSPHIVETLQTAHSVATQEESADRNRVS